MPCLFNCQKSITSRLACKMQTDNVEKRSMVTTRVFSSLFSPPLFNSTNPRSLRPLFLSISSSKSGKLTDYHYLCKFFIRLSPISLHVLLNHQSVLGLK
ncbi:hypothetical protein L1987_56286 [Smallanthus sonchifolius]|uniref:Uncharacterized protein n=1 Tax=Smallanthus sonchifolius TaxID=185202 RepID=A0ACB9EC89_9ASTR|nr:hypothetical protein L1987_56286 [Smallanthus sonchifolius]